LLDLLEEGDHVMADRGFTTAFCAKQITVKKETYYKNCVKDLG